MSLQNFIAKVGPTVSAAWLNAVDVLKFTIFGDANTKAEARANLTSDDPLEIVNGGTGVRSLADLITAVGGGFGPAQAYATSGTTLNLGAITTRNVLVAGANAVTLSFGTAASVNAPIYLVMFNVITTLTHGANLILPNATDITTSAGDYMLAQYNGSGIWRVAFYQYADRPPRTPFTDVASAATVDLGNTTGDSRYVQVTGTNTISSFGSNGNVADPVYILYFPSGLTINGSANLVLPLFVTSGSLTLNAGDSCTVFCIGADTWQIRSVDRVELSGTFVPTWTGFVSAPTEPVKYTKVGNQVTLEFGANHVGTSNSADLSFTGIPSALRPASTKSSPISGMQDSGSVLASPSQFLVDSGGNGAFTKSYSTFAWTNSGTKGFVSGGSFLVTYLVP